MRYRLLIVAVAIGFYFLTSCGSSGGSGLSNPGTVLAQSGYSNASLSGTYAFEIATSTSTTYLAIGTVQFNGGGNVSGSLTPSSNSNCKYSALSGSYSLQSTGIGTATINSTTSTPSVNCPANWTGQLSLAAAQQGQSLLFIGTTTGDSIIGTAIKQ